MEVIFGIGIVIFMFYLVFFLIPAWVSKVTGMGVRFKHSNSVSTPNDFDDHIQDIKKVAKKTKQSLSKKNELIKKQFKGTYKFIFDKIENLHLFEEDSKSLLKMIELKKKIEENTEEIKKLQETELNYVFTISKHPEYFSLKQDINKYNEYLPYIDKTDFKEYIDLVSKISNISPDISVQIIDKIGIKNANKVYLLLKQIEKGFWRNDLTKQEAEKLNELLYKKIVISQINISTI